MSDIIDTPVCAWCGKTEAQHGAYPDSNEPKYCTRAGTATFRAWEPPYVVLPMPGTSQIVAQRVAMEAVLDDL